MHGIQRAAGQSGTVCRLLYSLFTRVLDSGPWRCIIWQIMSEAVEITQVLQAIGRSEEGAAEKLLPLVYAELRRLAAARMAHEMAGQTLQPTALVHEAWLRLVKDGDRTWQNRAHFFGAAAEAMRRILIERARHKSRQTLRCRPSVVD